MKQFCVRKMIAISWSKINEKKKKNDFETSFDNSAKNFGYNFCFKKRSTIYVLNLIVND